MKDAMKGSLASVMLVILLAALVTWWQSHHPRREPEVTPGGASAMAKPHSPVNFAPDIRRHASGMVGALGLSETEQNAVDAAIAAKVEAREALLRQAFALFEVADDPRASKEEIAQAVNAFLRAKKACQRRIQDADKALIEKISLRARARLLCSGILDNGLGFMAGKPLPTMGMPRPASAAMPSHGM